MFRTSLIGLSMVLLSFTVQADMDCASMFQKSEDSIAGNEKLGVAKKVEFYEMAVEAYKQCEKGEEKAAKDLFDDVFNNVFDTSGRM